MVKGSPITLSLRRYMDENIKMSKIDGAKTRYHGYLCVTLVTAGCWVTSWPHARVPKSITPTPEINGKTVFDSIWLHNFVQ